MSAFTALNVEPDDTLDDDVDNTREIQIEEALKLYQSALRLHSQGPQYYDQAALSYDALFASDIFRYSESIAEFIGSDENPLVDNDPEFAVVSGADLNTTSSNGSPSTLPQILYLAYKNHGQFIMDCLKHQMRSGHSIPTELLLPRAQMALYQFSQALVRDESDTELWRRAARVGALLGSRTVARYCLEAAVEVDDDPTQGEVEPAGIEEGFAGMQLKEHLQVLSDDVALSHPIMAPYNKKGMSSVLKRHMDPYPFLPDLSEHFKLATINSREFPESRIEVQMSDRSWTALGEGLWKAYVMYPGSGRGVIINMPDEDKVMAEVWAPSEESKPPRQIQRGDSGISTKEATPISNGAQSNNTETTQNPRKEDEGRVEPPLAHSNNNSGEQDSNLRRKRSHSMAGIPETQDDETGGQKRSKRIRNRDTISNEGAPVDPISQFKELLREVRQSDDHMFTYIDSLLQKFDVTDLGTADDLLEAITADCPAGSDDRIQNTAVKDLQDVMRSWTDNKAAVLMSGGGLDILGPSDGSANAGLLAFLEHSKTGLKKTSERAPFSAADGLPSFVKSVNDRWSPLQDAVLEFLKRIHPTYSQNLWPDLLKNAVFRFVNHLDAEIYEHLQSEAERIRTGDDSDELANLESLVQMLFEIHLDIYASITDPNSVIEFATRTKEKESLERWRIFTSDLIAESSRESTDELILRYLWSSAFFASIAEGASREHIISCWNDVQQLLSRSGDPTIELQNNAVMAEISASAADREISRLTSMDFFLNLFQSDRSDPLAIIETLEPVLDPQSVGVPSAEVNEYKKEDEGSPQPSTDVLPSVPTGLRDMWKFLESGSTSLRLFLWQRLREAYTSINYSTKVFSCHLKSIEIIVADLQSSAYIDSSSESRQHSLLSWFKTLDDLLVQSLTLALNDQSSFEIIDEAHIKSSSIAVAQLTRLLHSAAIFEDGVRVGNVQLPRNAAYSHQGTFGTALVKFREMQVRSWALLYTLIKDGMSQRRDLFPAMESDLADYMATVHYSLGLRKCCKVSNKIFIKMMRVELVRMKNIERWEDYIGQVLFDLFGIRLGTGLYELIDHGCPIEPLDKRTTFAISDQVITLANGMPMKDLLKAELRPTIEKMQQAIGAAKSTPQMQHNLRNYTEYLKSSINPLRMIMAFRGEVHVDCVPIITPESPLADKGWYFLLGMMALTRFRSQKRLSPGATDDLKVAASFFRLQLQFTSELWETWYRLAQCFDAELEEEILWSAEKLNSERAPLNQLQRSSIHCYVMALSTAMRSANATFETASKLSDMYHDFGVRIYSSTREPFGMEAFYMDDFERHFSGDQGMYKKLAHKEMTKHMAWRYAASLFKRTLREIPNSWMSHYMLGKCLWKLYTKPDDDYAYDRPLMMSIISAFLRAIETAPKPKDNRAEPIFEPHYKLMSISHKLVMCGDYDPQEAAILLQRQPYAIRRGEAVEISDLASWNTFILESIRHLRNADKANWHHRMIYRVARIVCPENEPSIPKAGLARTELKDSMFTKTMVVQVWKPEFERPGRHCVYMERYVRFMVKLLWILDDKPNMEALVKRVRKKHIDYFHFIDVWVECCNGYMKLLRRAGNIAVNKEEALKSVTPDDFTSISDALELWCSDPASSHKALDCLREAAELKKLNVNLMKTTAIDDLINDAWATLFLSVGVNLLRAPPPSISPSNEPQSQGPMSLKNLVSNMDGTLMKIPHVAEAFTRPRNKAISRREILRRAEAAVAHQPEAPRPLPPSRARVSDHSIATNSNIKPPVTGPLQPRITAALRDETNEIGGESSAPGSLHDSADDESDLSDVPDMDEEAAAATTFPNLQGGDSNTDADDGEELHGDTGAVGEEEI